jgi:hypothetical protein
MKTWFNKAAIVMTCAAVMYGLIFSSCGKSGEVSYKPVQPKIENEFFGIIVPPKDGYKNLLVRDADGRVVLSLPQLNRKRIIILPKGSYEFSAANTNNAVLDLMDDCRIIIANRTFKAEPILPPPAIAFRSGNAWDLTEITQDGSYHLTILDLDDLGLSPGAYKAAISKGGVVLYRDISFSGKENNRVLSDQTFSFSEFGVYNVSVTVSGSTNKIKPSAFTVRELIFDPLVIKNIWNKKPLQYAKVQSFKILGAAEKDINGELTPQEYRNTAARLADAQSRILFQGNIEGNTGANGIIEIPNVRGNERIVIAMMNTMSKDKIYVRTIRARQKTEELDWKIPSKEEDRPFIVKIRGRDGGTWAGVEEDAIEVSMYYKPDIPATNISRQDVLDRNTFEKINTFRKEKLSDDEFRAYFDLRDLCIATNINWLLELETNKGPFYMLNVVDEITDKPYLGFQEDI